MGSLPSRGVRSFELLVRAGAMLVALGTLVSAGCAGRTERTGSKDSGAGGTSSAGEAGESAQGGTDSSRGGTDSSRGGSSQTGERCDGTVVDSCSSDQDRCCPGEEGTTCVPITWRSCTGCDEQCDMLTTDSCVDQTCTCGDGPPCSGLAKYCSEGTCVECFGDADCTKREGLSHCVEGACRECDPVDGSTCPEETPACSAEGECVFCSEDAQCPDSLFCDPEVGRCKACVEDLHCTDPFRPICFEYTDVLSECWGCESDEECIARDPEQTHCETFNGKCEVCVGHNDEGCDADEECLYNEDKDLYECRGCVEDWECDDDETPVCDVETHTCLPCNHPSVVDPDARCQQKELFAVCATVGEREGMCAICDPATHVGCPPEWPYCDLDAYCKECLGPGDCPDGFVCSPDQQCIGCTSDSDCENHPGGGQCIEVTGGKACRPCDPVDDAGCGPDEKCWAEPYQFVCSVP